MKQMEKIKIFTRSFDLKLYLLSRRLYDDLGVPTVRLTDQSADGYFYTMLKDTDCDIAINIDEDAFLVDPDALFRLVDYVVSNGYANAGCPDGGGFCPRGANPIVTNPFFNIFNLKLIRTKFDRNAIRDFRYADHKDRMIAAYPKERLENKYDFEKTDQEPYYPFFLWLANNFKTLYLPSARHEDGITTILLDPEGKPICLHTWFARFYTTPTWIVKLFDSRKRGMQKLRIDAVIDQAYASRGIERPEFGFGDRLSFLGNKIVRWIIKVPQRVSRWPYKIRKKLQRRAS